MDTLALEAKSAKNDGAPTPAPSAKPRPKPPKKPKRIVYFEVEIVAAKTKEKLLLLDKVCGFRCLNRHTIFKGVGI